MGEDHFHPLCCLFWSCSMCLVTQSCPTLCDPMDCSPQGSSVHEAFSRQEYWSGLPCPPPGDLFNPGREPRSPTMQADSLPFELPGKPKNTGVVSLSLLQGNILTHKLNRGLLHCRQIFLPAELPWKPHKTAYPLFYQLRFNHI